MESAHSQIVGDAMAVVCCDYGLMQDQTEVFWCLSLTAHCAIASRCSIPPAGQSL
ncbi:MAG: hypothetical protein V7752_10860 [Halopseudomonas sp.]